MTENSVPGIPAWQPIAQVGRAGRTAEQKRKHGSFEDDLAGGGRRPAGDAGSPAAPPADDAKAHERTHGDLEDGTGESLDVTA
jgi:hypothetical protein